MMKNVSIMLALLLALSSTAWSQYARPRNCYAAMVQLTAERSATQNGAFALDRIRVHQDVNGVKWEISDYGNVWKVVNDDQSRSLSEDLVTVSGSVIRWRSSQAGQREARVYSLQGSLIATLTSQTQELTLPAFGGSVAVVVVMSGAQVHHQLLYIYP